MKFEMTTEEFQAMFLSLQEENARLHREVATESKRAETAWDKFYTEERRCTELNYQVRDLTSKIGYGTGAALNEGQTRALLTAAYSGNKIQAIKDVRVVCGIGLKEAKDLVEDCQKAGVAVKPNYY